MPVKVTITSPTQPNQANPVGGNLPIQGFVDGPSTVTVSINDGGSITAAAPVVMAAAGNWAVNIPAPPLGDVILITASGQDATGVGSHTIRVPVGPPIMADGGGAAAGGQVVNGAAGRAAAKKKARTP
jgi:hypothetical protein